MDVEDLLEEVDVGDVLKERQVFEDIYNEVDFEDVLEVMKTKLDVDDVLEEKHATKITFEGVKFKMYLIYFMLRMHLKKWRL